MEHGRDKVAGQHEAGMGPPKGRKEESRRNGHGGEEGGREGKGQLKISRDRFAGDRARLRLLEGELRHLQHSITFIGGVDQRWR